MTLLGRDAEAVADFDRAAAIRPDIVDILDARAQSFERLGAVDPAKANHAAAEK